MADSIVPLLTKAYRDKETLPKKFDTGAIVNLLQGIHAAKTSGVPLSKTAEEQLTAEKVGNRILKEGRADAGANEFDVNNKKALDFYRLISNEIFNSTNSDAGARFAAAVMDKAGVSDRTGISFDRLYNGTGKSKESGRTGADYSKELAAAQGAINDPRNANFKDLIQRGIAGKLTSSETVAGMPEGSVRDTLFGPRAYAHPENVENVILDTAKKLNMSPERISQVKKDLGADRPDKYANISNIVQAKYKTASGVDIGKLDSGELARLSPDTNAVLDTLLGVTPK
jgi:hypothetical protein